MVERVVRLFTGFLLGIYTARYFGPEKYGVLQYAVSLVSFIGIFVYLGLQGVVVRDIVKDPTRRDVLLGTTATLKSLGSVIGCGVVALVVYLFRGRVGDEPAVVLIVGASLLLKPLETADYWFESQVQSKYTALRKTMSVVVASVARVMLFVLRAPLVAFAVMVFVESAISGVLIIFFYSRRVGSLSRWRFSFPIAAELLGQSWLLILSGFMAVVNLKVDQILLRWLTGPSQVGIYAVAVTLSESWYFVASAIVASVFPFLVADRSKSVAVYRDKLQQDL